MSNVSYFGNANNVVAKKLTFNTYASDGDALQFLYNHSATGAVHDSEERFPPPVCHPGTRQAVVGRITAWYGYLTLPQRRIMWVHAPAGYGRTAVAGTVSKLLEEQEGLDFCPLGATFFFWRSSPERNSPACFIITIAYQLATSIPELKPHIEDAVKQNPMILKKALEAQLVKLIVEPFKALGQYVEEMPNRLIIIDGLDECINSNRESRVAKKYAEGQEKVQVRVLDLIHALQSHQLPLSFLILSRPEPWIKQHIESDLFKESVEIIDLYEVGDHMNDVETYIRAELSRIAATINHPSNDEDVEWPGENTVRDFIVKTNGHMLYASTVLGHIDDPYDDPRSRLNDILNYPKADSDLAHSTPFSSLYQLYRQILQSCPASSHPRIVKVLEDLVETQWLFSGSTSIPRALNILDPLSGRAAGSGVRALRGLHAVLHLPTASLPRPLEWFIHSSFITFLRIPQFSLEFTIDRKKAYRRLLRGCLNTMSTITLQSVCEDHHHFALLTWTFLWWLLWDYEYKPSDDAEYFSMLKKLLESDFEACFFKTFTSHERQFILSRPPGDLYYPGPNNFIVPSSARYVYDSDSLVQQAVSRLHTSGEDVLVSLISQPSPTGGAYSVETFVSHLVGYMVAFTRRAEGVKDWESNKVLQALKKLRREDQKSFDLLADRIKSSRPVYGLSAPNIYKVIDYICQDAVC
ncbi:hypothetical protein EST38_g9184 [Candolleomyces aberdarensis]|uniref:Nephrocystin 3-like N-terminal domain-containing protein n=1 Tax=Candolleomyces aberdarensis TaxID=2316362 RepID=A0A4Q2DAK6_9AGAR|nr:hypothetical protein EST38_g9184 [Candolleomyces aberdarensis]